MLSEITAMALVCALRPATPASSVPVRLMVLLLLQNSGGHPPKFEFVRNLYELGGVLIEVTLDTGIWGSPAVSRIFPSTTATLETMPVAAVLIVTGLPCASVPLILTL